MRLAVFTSWGGTYPVAFLERLFADQSMRVIKVFSQGVKESALDQSCCIVSSDYIDPVYSFLLNRGSLDLYERISSVNTSDFIRHLKAIDVDCLVFIGYGEILSSLFLSSFGSIALNIHPGLLPLNKGADPITSAILRPDIPLGISIHRLSERIDSGEILASVAIDTNGLINSRFAIEWKLGIAAQLLLHRLLVDNDEYLLPSADECAHQYFKKPGSSRFDIQLGMPWDEIRLIQCAVDHVFSTAHLCVHDERIPLSGVVFLGRIEENMMPGSIICLGYRYALCSCADSVFCAMFHGTYSSGSLPDSLVAKYRSR